MVVDASSTGYGAALMDEEGNVVAMMSKRNKTPWAHSSESELDAMLQALRTFRHLTLGRCITVYRQLGLCKDVELEKPKPNDAQMNG